MFGLGLGRMGLVGDLGFAIRRSLFGRGEQGLWYDLNDDATIFQDSAGTTLATWGDPVGLVLDKHDGLATSLIYTSNFSAGVDGATGTRLTIDGNIDGIGGQDNWLRGFADATNSSHFYNLSSFSGLTAGAQYKLSFTYFIPSSNTTAKQLQLISPTGAATSVTAPSLVTFGVTDVAAKVSVYFIAGSQSLYYLRQATGAGAAGFIGANSVTDDLTYIKDVRFELVQGNHAIQSTSGSRPIRGRMPKRGRVNLLVSTATLATQNVTTTNVQQTLSFTGTGTVTLSGTSTAGPLVGTGASNRVSLTFTPSAGTLTLTVTGSVTLAQLQLGAAFDNYQAVNDALGFNITESGQPSCGYLSYNGSNQWMQTAAAVNFTATDEMSVFAGVRKNVDTPAGVLIETSASINLNTGAIYIGVPYDPTFEFGNISRGSTAVFASVASINSATYAAPISVALTGVMEISSDTNLLRINGAQVATSAGDQGTGNYGNYITYFGSRAGTTAYFNGLMFSTIIRGALTSGTLLTRTEQYVARQTPTVNL